MELAREAALRRETGLVVPEPVVARDGSLVQTVAVDGMPEARHCVLFRWVEGHFLRARPTWRPLRQAGAFLARLHEHAERFIPPKGFTRPRRDAPALLGQLLEQVPAEQLAVPIPAAQPIDRDLALSVDEATPLGEVLRILRASAGPALIDARVFDEYRGAQVGEGRVSYAIALRFQPETAGDEKGVERAMKRLRGTLQHHLGAMIR